MIDYMADKCFVIEKSKLTDYDIIAEKGSSKFTLTNAALWSKIANSLSREGVFKERFNNDNIENNPNYKQIIPYIYVVKNNKFLIYQRASSSDHKEARLYGKISLGIGGHIDYGENLTDALFREFNEEARLLIDGKEEHFKNTKSSQNFQTILKPKYTGIIDDERDAVGMVHLGVAVEISLPENYNIEIKNSESKSFEYITLQEYEKGCLSGKFIPEGWTNIVIENIFKK
jgi:predicted NUDIX family phosphoesterase